MKLSIVMPVYNEEKTVLNILEKVNASVSKLDEKITDFEILIVDDGSKDNTRNVLSSNFENHKKIKLFFQEENMGKGAAITRGFAESTGDIVIVQDADLEYDPEDYPILFAPILNGKADVVYGSRFKGTTTRVLYFWHSVGNKFLTFLSNAFTDINLTDMETCYKVFKGDLIRSMKLESKRFGIEPEMTAKISKVKGIRIYEVPISYDGRTYDEGKKIGWKDGFSALWCILKFNLMYSCEGSFKKPMNQVIQKI